MSYKISLLPLFAVLALAPLGCHKQDSEAVKNLKWLDSSHLITDVKTALSKGDHRLLAVRGLTISIPGTDPKDFQEYKIKYGIRELEGTTDALTSNEHARLVQKAIDYSMAYNMCIIHDYKPQNQP